ncbi:UNVERIFIED_CONTAM: hypothetical protein Sangu_1788200 [Sesamum angustifolium]|uniref:Uncharacterized protein n=1 Tax=Sesamum angustifolium TaxID=2727405 RepID=A0AAW2M9V0_9LAMI
MEETDKDIGATAAAVAVGAAAGVAALAAWGISKWFGSSEPKPKPPRQGKMMKAPGQDGYIPRKDFVDNPSDYFRGLRGKKRQTKQQE